MKTISLALTLALSSGVFAVETRSWVQDERAEFEKGKLKNLSLRSDGRLLLAPAFHELFDASTPYLWSLAEDSKGNVYAGGGGPGGSGARIFVIGKNGQGKKLAELDGLEVHALAVDAKGRLYAGTAPDGKVYRVSSDGKSQVFYDPKAKYIWALTFDSKGNLYVATGDQGEIHRVTPDGKGAVFFKTEESHARSLAVDREDNLIAGTEPGGLILRVSPKGEGYVLYQAPKREITTVAVAPDGSLYAAAVGSKLGITLPPVMAPAPVPAPTAAPAGRAGTATVAPHASAVGANLGSMGAGGVAGGSEVYRIDREGYPRKVWSDTADIVYAITFDANGRPILGTGNKGNIYRLDSDILSTLLVSAAPTQVTDIRAVSGGRIFAATGNIGKVLELGPAIEKQGTIESDVFDAGAFSYWGRLVYQGTLNGGTVAFESRTGNLDRPQQNWSPWAPVPLNGDGGRISSPAARFVQWKATVNAAADGKSPMLGEVDVAYLARNAAPVMDAIEITPPNYRFAASSLPTPPANRDITLAPLGQRSRGSLSMSSESSALSMNYAKGYLAVRWAANDENGDRMEYKVEVRGVKESEWKLLKDHVTARHHSFDTTAFPDGEYVIRVTATDAPSNPPAQALTTSIVSDPFLVDNTAPQIAGLTGSISGNQMAVQFKAKDARSNIGKVEYSVNGGTWMTAVPTTRLTDGPELDYDLKIERTTQGEQTVAVRVEDEYDNVAVEKVVLR